MNLELSNIIATSRHLAKLSRFQNSVFPGLLAALSSYLFSKEVSISVFCYLFFVLSYTIAASYNNLSDVETDKINKRIDNPLTYGLLSKRVVYIHILINAFALGVLQTGLKQPESLAIGVALILLSYLYSGKPGFKSFGLFSTLILSILYGGAPLVLGLIQSNKLDFSSLMYLMFLQILLLSPILLAKDYKDIKGDKQTGKLTPLILYGERVVKLVSVIVSVAACVLILLITSSNLILFVSPFYLIMVYILHKKQGMVSPVFNKVLLLVVLTISLLSAAKIY